MNSKDLQEIKFSLNVILRELKYLMSHPVFQGIKEDLDKSIMSDMNDDKSVLNDVMTKVEEKLIDLEHIETPNYAAEGDTMLSHAVPAENLAPPVSKVTTFGSVIDNFWLSDGIQSPDASSKILVAISPVLRAPGLDKDFFKRNKRDLDLPLIDPLSLNDELMSKLVFRRAILNDNSYNYDRPEIKFQEGASGTVEEKEYLPPLETSPDIINIVKQPYSKETGYEYKKPSRPFNLPSETVTVKTIVTTTSTTKAPKIQEEENKDYLPPYEGSSANNVPQIDDGYEYKRPDKPFLLPNDNDLPVFDVRSSNEVPTKITTKRPDKDYLPPFQPSSTNQLTTIVKEDGYSYPKPSRPFPPLQPSPSNTVKPQTVRPTQAPTTTTTTTTRRPTTEKEYLPPKYETSNSDGGKIETYEPPKQKYDPINGYDYTKPSIPFETSNTNESPNYEYPKQKYDPVNGYDYAKPSIKFETALDKDYLPPKSSSLPTRQSKGIQVIALGGETSVYDKLNPVNRLSEDIFTLTRTP